MSIMYANTLTNCKFFNFKVKTLAPLTIPRPRKGVKIRFIVLLDDIPRKLEYDPMHV